MGLQGCEEGQAEAPVECVGPSDGGLQPSVVLSSPPRVLVNNALLEHSHAHLPTAAFSLWQQSEKKVSYPYPGALETGRP